MWLVIPLLTRIIQALIAVWKLVADWEVTRRLPWRYLRHRIRTDWCTAWQVAGMICIVIVYPIGLNLPEPWGGTVTIVGFLGWLSSLLPYHFRLGRLRPNSTSR